MKESWQGPKMENSWSGSGSTGGETNISPTGIMTQALPENLHLQAEQHQQTYPAHTDTDEELQRQTISNFSLKVQMVTKYLNIPSQITHARIPQVWGSADSEMRKILLESGYWAQT